MIGIDYQLQTQGGVPQGDLGTVDAGIVFAGSGTVGGVFTVLAGREKHKDKQQDQQDAKPCKNSCIDQFFHLNDNNFSLCHR